ncbi:retrovirus-related pol polyprotein from transposon TNT 1-94 [Tanacetum coccineum]
MNGKMKNLECVQKKVKITPPDYSKENYLATFTPQKQLTPEQIFWSQDLIKMKAEALKTQATTSTPIKALTMYPPNTPATLVLRVLPTKSQGSLKGKGALTKEIKEMKDIFEELEAEVDQNGVDRKHDEIEQKNLLIANDNLIADCLSKEVFYVATNSERNKDSHSELVKWFSNLEVNHLNLQLKYQNLKESFGNNTSLPARDDPDFNLVFVIKKIKASIQGKDNAIKKLRMQISQLKETRSEADRTLDFRTLDFQITQLTKKINVLQEQNELFREENKKIKQHYKELYDSIKIMRAKHLKQTTALLTENESLKVQIQNKLSCVNKDHVKPKVLATGKDAIDVEPIPHRNRNNREVHLVYLKHLKESVETLREIIKEAKVERPLDSSLASVCLYTKHSQATKLSETNVPVPSSTGVNSCTDASRSQPRSNTKKNRILLAKSVNMKKVEEHHRTIKSSLKTTNRVDSSISSKRTVVQIVLWYLDSGCSKHMMGDRSRLKNFKKKFIGIVKFGNDHFGAIMGYGDYVIGESVISRVYYVEGLGHNLFSVRQFYDSDLEVAFRKHSCYVRDTNGVELIKGSRGSNLHTISIEDMMKSSTICLLSKASKNKSWLWHRRLNYLNFGTINDLARKDLVQGLPRLKFEKDNLCSACQLGKSKKHTHKPKTENTNLEVKFFRSKDETPEVVIKFLKQIQVGLNKTVRNIRTDNGTEFVNKDLTDYYERVSIFYQKTVPRTPQQNGVVERRNRTLVKAARTMLIFSKAPMFLWAEVVATTCYTQNRSFTLVTTPYELVHDKKPDLTFFRVFGALCYPTNNNEDLGKLQPTTDIGIFVGYAPSRKGIRPAPTFLTTGQISSGLVPNSVPATPYVPPTNKELEILIQPIFNEYMEPLRVKRPVFPAPAVQVPVNLAGVAAESTLRKDNPFAPIDNDPFLNVFSSEPISDASSFGDLSLAESPYVSQTLHHLGKWSKDHLLDNIIVEPKNFKSTIIEDCWIQAMQDEIHKFDRLQV